MEIIQSGHGVYQLQYHVVWVCKYRHRFLNPSVCDYFSKMMPKLLKGVPGVTIETIGFDEDHVHMVMVIPPKYSIANVMGRLKSQSSSRMRKTFPEIKKKCWKEPVVWSPGYFVSSVGIDEEIIKNPKSRSVDQTA